MRERTLTIANTGDSRAVIARRRYNSKKKSLLEDDDAAAGGRGVSVNPHDVETTGPRASNKESDNSDQMIAVDLSVDQNPDSPGEQERIESCGGFVSPPPEEGLSARVWLDPDFTHIGLAMSRSIGDHAVKPVGVISEPVVTTYEITDDDEFMIIATDGVWEFIDSCEAVRIVNERLRKGRGASAACQALIETAALRWKEHEGSYRDDITAAVVKVKELWEDHSDQ